MPTNLVVKDKATAMQYAISQARVYSENSRCYILNLELANNIFKMFIDNVELPDVSNGGCCGECPTMTQEMEDELSGTLKESLEQLKESRNRLKRIGELLSKNDTNDAKNSEHSLSDIAKGDLHQTYDDVAEELFGEEKESWCIIGNSIPIVQTNALFDIPDKSVRCISYKQTQKVIAINCLLNVAKYLNGDWTPDWRNEGEAKFCVILNNGNLHVDLDLFTTCNNSFAYFRTKELAQRAIDILGEYTIRLALSTDY